MAALERLSQPLDLEAGAEQCEQASEQDHSTLDRQQEVDARIKFGKMPEDDDAEQRAAEDETETAEKKKYMMEENLRISKRIGTSSTRHQYAICITQRTPNETRSEKTSRGN